MLIPALLNITSSEPNLTAVAWVSSTSDFRFVTST
jgi:hypothetical protein